jgi:4-hydroxybenzoate polyprenyltransferase/phosphoserine phosphatase
MQVAIAKTTNLPKAASLPHLYVDLDGTLLATNLLHESTLQLLRNAPLSALQIPAWLLRGKAFMKRCIAERVDLDASVLPYRLEVLDLIRRAREQGRRVVLATASDEKLARAVAQHLGLFDQVLASNGAINLSGLRKLEAIRADAAEHAFSYAGNDQVDVAIWQEAAAAVVVSNSESLRSRATGKAALEQQVPVPRPTLRNYLYGLRLHQWLKNLLVFLPLLPIISTTTQSMALRAVAMFFAFSLCASSIYVFNDLLDLEADRHHHRKRKRPFASGLIPISQAVPLGAGLLLASAALAIATLPPLAIAALVAYMLLTTAYSAVLKRRMLVDVFALAMLYTMRILAGSAATDVEPSFWLLGFSMFMFLSLALAKRYVEVDEMRAKSQQSVKGRAYIAGDGAFVMASGVASGQISILTLSLYLNDPTVAQRYSHPFGLWMLCPLLLYWLVRIWLKAHRGELHDDPVVFAVTDRISQAIVAISVALVYWAS